MSAIDLAFLNLSDGKLVLETKRNRHDLGTCVSGKVPFELSLTVIKGLGLEIFLLIILIIEIFFFI